MRHGEFLAIDIGGGTWRGIRPGIIMWPSPRDYGPFCLRGRSLSGHYLIYLSIIYPIIGYFLFHIEFIGRLCLDFGVY